MTLPDMSDPVPAGPKRIPFVTDLLRMVRVLVSPTPVFEEQREEPTVWIPLLIVIVLTLVVTSVAFPIQMAAARMAAAQAGRPFPAAAEVTARTFTYIIVPVVTLIFILFSAGVMYVALIATGGSARYRGLLSVVVLTGLVGVIEAALLVVVLKVRDPASFRTIADYQASFGLDLLLPSDLSLGRFLGAVTKRITPFSLWSLVLLAIGVRVTERTSRAAAWTAAIASFVCGLLLVGGLSMLGPAAR